MKEHSSAIAPAALPLSTPMSGAGASATAAPASQSGLLWGLVGVAAFSFTMPLTRLAVADLPATFIATGRAVVAGLCAAVLLMVLRQRFPGRELLGRLTVVALGVVVGFPWLSTLALTSVPASHAAVVVGLLPAATAVVSVIRTGERPSMRFWIAAGLGAAAVCVFATISSGGLGTLQPADLLLLGAVLAAAIGYAEGGLLAKRIGSWQTICWALVLALPVMTTLTLLSIDHRVTTAGPPAWASFGYLGLVSMFLGFFAWYRGLAIGPMSHVSQVQLVQPVLSIAWAAVLLGEALTPGIVAGALVVIACAATAVRSR